MTQTQKINTARWALIISVLSTGATCVVCTVKLLAAGTIWYTNIMQAINNSSTVNETQNTNIANHERRINNAEDKLDKQQSRLDDIEFEVTKIKYHVK